MTSIISPTHPIHLPLPTIQEPSSSSSDSDTDTQPTATTRPPRPHAPSRSSSNQTRHHTLLTRLRPLPFQYIFSLHHTKSTSTTTPTLLAPSIPDIATFYKIYNNFPWEALPLRDAAHVFRSGVRPLWEDPENRNGGCWVLKVRREGGKAVRCWEELCLMVCGGELQGVVCGGKCDLIPCPPNLTP